MIQRGELIQGVQLIQGGILPPIMGGKWKFEDFLPPIFEDPGGQIIDVLPPISRDPGGQINVFAPHHGGQMSPPQAGNFGISSSK